MAAVAEPVAGPFERLDVSAFPIPTDRPESDGTLEWDSTTTVVVEVSADGESGLGYTYADSSAAHLIDVRLRRAVEGADATAVGAVKVGRDPEADLERVRVARSAIGQEGELFVDANGAYGRKQSGCCSTASSSRRAAC